MSTDPDHRFDLAISLNDLETALDLVRAAPEAGSQAKWKLVGDKALSAWQMDLAQESFEKAGDLPALLLLFTSLSDRKGMERLAQTALEKGANNIAFAAFLQLGDSQSCVDLLAKTGRLPEAALFARSHHPQAVPKVVKQWRAELEENGKEKVAATIADPEEDGSLFTEGWAGSGVPDGEGSGVMVENEGESQQGFDVAGSSAGAPVAPSTTSAVPEASAKSTGEDEAEGEGEQKTSEKIKEKVDDAVDKVKEPVEGLVDKVKDLTVNNGDQGASIWTLASTREVCSSGSQKRVRHLRQRVGARRRAERRSRGGMGDARGIDRILLFLTDTITHEWTHPGQQSVASQL